MTLEAFQSGLSWLTILGKRSIPLAVAFGGFDIQTVAGYTDADVARLPTDPGIVTGAKIEATIANARVAADLEVDLCDLLWSHAPGPAPRPASSAQVPLARPRERRLRRLGPAAQRPRLPVRRTHDGICVDAGHRNGRRPLAGLLGAPNTIVMQPLYSSGPG